MAPVRVAPLTNPAGAHAVICKTLPRKAIRAIERAGIGESNESSKCACIALAPDRKNVSLKDQTELVETYATDFFTWFFGLLTRPFSVGTEIQSNKRHILFLIFCALIGATVGALIPGRPPISERSRTAVTVVVVWTLIGVLIHFACRLFRGKGSLDRTVLATLQILAVGYVVSNSLTMLITMAETAVPRLASAIGATGLKEPGELILFLQFCIVAIYTPMVLKSVHRFSGLLVGTLVGLVAALIAVLIASPVVMAHGC